MVKDTPATDTPSEMPASDATMAENAPLVAEAPSVDTATMTTPAPSLEEVMTENEGLRSRLQRAEDENTNLKEQLALHAASNAPDAADALRQIHALAAPFA